MSDYTRTTNYSLYKPVPGEDDDVWGDHWNANADTLDGIIRQIDQRGSGGGVLLVTDYLPAGQPDGITDLAPYFQDAIDAAAGADPANRAAAPGFAELVIPAAPAPYIIGTSLYIPSHSHIIVGTGATLQIARGAAADCFHMAPNVTDIVIELYGTLDGNAANAVAPSGGIGASNPCSNILVQGGNTGLITNFINWPVNINCCTNGEVRGVAMTNSGNSPGFSGITSRVPIGATGSSYVSATGVLTLSTAPALHGINVGDIFYYWSSTGAASGLQGEYVAVTGTTPAIVVAQAATALTGDLTITSPGQIGTCVRCYNVGFVDCYVRNIRDVGLCLYSGCNGSYIRNCDVDAGPVIFADAGQPAPCVDCEISGCYTHDGGGGGPGVLSNQAFIYHRNTKVFSNTVANMARGGIGLGFCDGADVYGNILHDNQPGLDGQCGQSGQILVSSGAFRANVHDNAIRNNGPSSTAAPVISLASPFGTYNNTTGAVSLTTTSAHGLAVGARFYVLNMTGSGNYLALHGWQTTTAGTAGSTINYNAAPGLGTVTITSGAVIAFVYALSSTITGGTYNAGTGNVVLTTAAAHGLVSGKSFVLSGMTGTGNFDALNGLQIATAGTSGTTLNFTEASGLVLTITGGMVLPANFGITVNSPPYCRISGNKIGDYQTTMNMTAGVGGTCGNHNLVDGNYYGPRLATGGFFPADACIYAQASAQGMSYDTLIPGAVSGQVVTRNIGGMTNFPGTGLTVGWNTDPPVGNIGFLCGRGPGTGGGFSFKQVGALGTIDTSVGLAGTLLANDGYGNTRIGGAVCQGGFQTGTIASGGTLAVLPNMGFVYVNNASSIAAATITLPAVSANAFTNNELEIVFAATVGALTLTPAAGNTILTPPTTVTTAGAAYRFIRNGTVWIRRIAA